MEWGHFRHYGSIDWASSRGFVTPQTGNSSMNSDKVEVSVYCLSVMKKKGSSKGPGSVSTDSGAPG